MPKQKKQPKPVQLTPAEKPMPIQPTKAEIAKRAHDIYKARGGAHGRDLDDWLQAERELQARGSGKL